jgi:hypothetical protein
MAAKLNLVLISYGVQIPFSLEEIEADAADREVAVEWCSRVFGGVDSSKFAVAECQMTENGTARPWKCASPTSLTNQRGRGRLMELAPLSQSIRPIWERPLPQEFSKLWSQKRHS